MQASKASKPATILFVARDSDIPLIERRGYPRRYVRKPVVVKSARGSTTASGTTANVSSSGVLLNLDISFAVGISVELVFDMPTLAGDSYYPVRCLGRIVRVEPSGNRYAVAVAFERVDIVGQA